MSSSKQLIPKAAGIVSAFIIVISSILISVFVFYIPHNRTRTTYQAATCIVQSAKLACNNECRLLKVRSSSFSEIGMIQRNGRANAPCNNAQKCNEKFTCLFRKNPFTVREQISKVSVGFVIFLCIAALIGIPIIFLALYQSLKSYPINIVLFVPQGFDTYSLIDCIQQLWPLLETRQLKYTNLNDQTEFEEQGALAIIETPWAEHKSGMIIVAVASASVYQLILEIIPESFYRVVVIPSLQTCIHHELTKLQGNQKSDETTEENIVSHRSDENKYSEPESSLKSVDIIEQNVREAYHKLNEMSASFDSVYKVGKLETGNYRWIARRATLPYISYKIRIRCAMKRMRNNFNLTCEWVLSTICCQKNDEDRVESNQQSEVFEKNP